MPGQGGIKSLSEADVIRLKPTTGANPDPLVSKRVGPGIRELNNKLAKNNLTAIIDPTVNDDLGQGYTKNSIWINTITKIAFRLFEETQAAAIWKKTPLETEVVLNNTHRINTTNPHNTTKTQVGLGNVQNTKVNLIATVDPTSTNDNTQGYSLDSRWLNTVSKNEFVAVDVATGAAIWKSTTSAALGAHTHRASDITDFEVEVSNNPSVTTNSTKVSASGSVNAHSDVDIVITPPVANDVLTWNAINSRFEAAPPPGATGGEANTGSNVGTAGIGVFKNKVGTDLKFKKLNNNGGLELIDDTANDKIDFKVVFGSEYQFTELVSQVTVVDPIFTNYLSLVTPSIPIGDYRITVTVAISGKGGGTLEWRVQLDTVDLSPLLEIAEPADPQIKFKTIIFNKTITTGIHTIDIDFREESGSDKDVRMEAAKIEIWRIS